MVSDLQFDIEIKGNSQIYLNQFKVRNANSSYIFDGECYIVGMIIAFGV